MQNKGNKTKCIIISLIALLLTTFISFAYFLPHQIKKDNLTAIDKVNNLDTIIRIRIVVAGDAMMHQEQISAGYIKDSNKYDFNHYFIYIKDILSKSDFNLINFETTLAGSPYTGYPQFCAPDAYAIALRNAGFNFFVTANNHSVDKGLKGIIRTINVFDSIGTSFTGTFRSKIERDSLYPPIIDVKGIKIAILNYTYGTNGLKVPHPAIVNLIDTNLIAEDIKITKAKSPDIIIAAMHWGNEYERKPSKEQNLLAEFLIRQDVDIIAGSHPHVIQPISLSKSLISNKQHLIIWSLGNFVSNQRRQYTNGGLMVQFDIEKNLNTSKVSIDSVGYYPLWVYKTDAPVKYYILPANHFDNDSLKNSIPQNHINTFKIFIDDTRKHLYNDSMGIIEFKYK